MKVVVVDPDVEVPFTVRLPLPTDVTLPNALVKGTAPPPNPPPPPPPPPNPLPANPPGRVQPDDVAAVIETVRAEAGPEEPVAPNTWTHAPMATSDALAVTVWVNAVDDVQSTVTVLPVRAFWTTIDDELTEEIEPEARGRPCAAGFAAVGDEEADVALELHAPSNAPAATTTTVSRWAVRGRAEPCGWFIIDLCSSSVRRPLTVTIKAMVLDHPVRLLRRGVDRVVPLENLERRDHDRADGGHSDQGRDRVRNHQPEPRSSSAATKPGTTN